MVGIRYDSCTKLSNLFSISVINSKDISSSNASLVLRQFYYQVKTAGVFLSSSGPDSDPVQVHSWSIPDLF